MAKLRVEGLEELQKKLKSSASLKEVKMKVRKNSDQMNKRMKKITVEVFVKGHTLGGTAGSINTVIEDDGLTGSVGPTTDYSMYVEYGTRFMKAEPFIRPALEEQTPKFKEDMQKLVK